MRFEKVVSVGKPTIEKTMDIEVDTPEHLFYANGVAVSNSHAVSYSAISTAQMWLKYNYFPEFMCSLIDNTPMGKKKHGSDNILADYINYARRKGLKLMHPDVNKSEVGFTLEDGKIRFSLGHVKFVANSAQLISSFQPIKDMEDFHERVKATTVSPAGRKSSRRPTKKVVEALIYAGAFTEWGTKQECMDEYYAQRANKKESSPQLTEDEWDAKEREVLGLILSKPTLYEKSLDLVKEKGWHFAGEKTEKKKVMIFGRIDKVAPHTSKSGNSMYRVTMSDDMNNTTFFVFKGAMNFFRFTFKEGMIAALPMSRFDDGGMRFYDDKGTPVIVSR